MYIYLILNLLTISFPLIRSFENKVNYFSNWLYIFIALFLNSVFFIIWDIYFTASGVWAFNEIHILGFHILGLPIEEWMFFFTVPFACLFIYEVLKYFVKKNPLEKMVKPISILLIFLFLGIALLHVDKMYTFTNFLLCSIFLILHLVRAKPKMLADFYLTYIVHLIPFGIVNGILTFLPVVIYNNAENMGLRFFTIPLEDFGYSFLLLLNNISIYEYLKIEFPSLKLKPSPFISNV